MLRSMREYLAKSAAPVYSAWTDSYLHAWLAARGFARPTQPAPPPYTPCPSLVFAAPAPVPVSTLDFWQMHELALQARREARAEVLLVADQMMTHIIVLAVWMMAINCTFFTGLCIFDRLMLIKAV